MSVDQKLLEYDVVFPSEKIYKIIVTIDRKLRKLYSSYYILTLFKTVFYSHTFIFMLSSNKVWEKRLISGLSQAGTAWLRKSSRYDSRDFWAGLGGPSTSSRLR